MKSRFIMRLSVLLLWIVLLVAGCKPYHDTPVDALVEFPGYLNNANNHSFQLLTQENIAGGTVLLYAYESSIPDLSGQTCVATTFVTREKNGSWRAQSASSIGCGKNYPDVDAFIVMYTVGGNITDLTTVYGLSNYGNQARIQWSDGLVDKVPLENGFFLKSRSETLRAQHVDLLNVDGDILETWQE